MLGAMNLSAQIPIGVPKISASTGTDIRIPLNVGDLTGQNVTSFEFVVSCDTNIIRLTGIDQEGTLSTGLTMFANNRVRPYGPGKMKVVCASAQPLSGNGVLVYLTGRVQKVVGDSQFQLTGLVLNTGTPGAQITNGMLTTIGNEKSKNAVSRDTIPLTKKHSE
jgi:hypothetical protein